MKIYGVIGWKNAGKTGLMERLVAEITARGFTVSTVKHAHHTFDVDHPGKDSHRHRMAGAREVLLSSRNRFALMHELSEEEEPSLPALLAKLAPVDLVLVEGYKRDAHPKIEAHRAETGNPLIADDTVRAFASDVPLPNETRPVFDLDDTKAIAEFILTDVGLINTSKRATTLAPPPLSNDCFALPPGVDWQPVDEALALLETRLHPVAKTETCALMELPERILAEDITAKRSNPPHANTAVDGYGFAHASLGPAPHVAPLVQGRAAAGLAYQGTVPQGHAIRILTGAALPEGIDTVVLEEDTTTDGAQIAFNGPIKPGSNTRKAGEDFAAGDVILPTSRRVTAADIALLSAAGIDRAEAFKPLTVGVLSTGDELIEPGATAAKGQIFDANRPMLLSLLKGWGIKAVDLGIARDDRAAIAEHLDQASETCDAILTSGGASAGDEDHVSALLNDTGSLAAWRIALKPGRPLALGVWKETPVFGLPGNPVAALVCTLIFARPALNLLGGAGWRMPQGVMVPAGFSKNKKPGRREYLRARLRNGQAEVFKSEGSGRISGLSWAEGLVELPDGAATIEPGTPVKYIPFSEV